LTLQTIFVEQLPIPKASAKEKETIGALVQKSLEAKGVGCEELESAIDRIVARLYGLTDEEVVVVGG
jgi:hypothetical protein